MQRAGRAWVVFGLVACGPAVAVEDTAGDASGGADESTSATSPTLGTTTTATTVADATGPGSSSDVGGTPEICGDGIVGASEACDDGNQDDADGCSPACEVSGTLRWTVEFNIQQGGGVALVVHDTDAYALVQEYDDFIPAQVLTARTSTEGAVFNEFAEPGNADWDSVRNALGVGLEGEVAVGYYSDQGRAIAALELGVGVAWGDEVVGYGASLATRWASEGIFTLRSRQDGTGLAIVRYATDGELADEIPLDPSAGVPLSEGGLLTDRPSMLLVFTESVADGVRIQEAFIPPAGSGESVSWSVSPVSPPNKVGSQARAFREGVELSVWTDDTRITIDQLNHPQPGEPRDVLGFVLVAFAGGFVISEGRTLTVYDADSTERWSATSSAAPRLARPDGVGGLYVLSDNGFEGDYAVLEHYVL